MREMPWQQYGIDYENGLRQFAGNSQIYEKYLAQYPQDTHCEDAFAAFRRGDLAEVQKQVHALKGLAGTLGMTRLFECCSVVVKRLKDEKARCDFGALEEEMACLKMAQEDILRAFR